MPELITEGIILVLDASRSMFRADYSPSRLEACKAGIKYLIENRLQNEAELGGSSAFGLITIQDKAQVLVRFDDYGGSELITNKLDEIVPNGRSALGEGVGMAIKLLIEDIRTSGARAPHIIIFSDGKYSQSKVDPLKMANLAKQLGMRIDTIRVGDVEHFNVMKEIAEKSNGRYFFANNSNEIIANATKLAVPNILPSGGNYGGKKNIISRKVLKKIAAPLLTESEMNKGTEDQKGLIARIRGTKSYQKCSICFQSDDPISKTDFSISGRYCPNCGTPMHGSCASQWGRNQDKEGDGTVFRCVHCLYLLKIPSSIQTAVRMHQNVQKELKREKNVEQGPRSFNVSLQRAQEIGDAALYSACPICNGIFDEEEDVIQCGNPDCNAIYHQICFKKLKNSTCKVCGSKLVRLFQ